jgi:glycosyltransferase involved in cell wall biosynthesis
MKNEINMEPRRKIFLNEFQKAIKSTAVKASSMEPGLPEILFITTYPPRECGIASYSQDLIKALDNKFKESFKIKICLLESGNEKPSYADSIPNENAREIKYILNTDHPGSFSRLAASINEDIAISMVLIQHEFGLFEKKENDFMQLLHALVKPVAIVFHTVLPHPNESLKLKVREIAELAASIIVMTHSSASLLEKDYLIAPTKINVIPHGTHLVQHSDRQALKNKYNLNGKKILATFGLLGSGKSIETTLEALPEIVKNNPDVLFLIIGKTHPSVLKQEGEKYREMLQTKVAELQLQEHVQFINCFLPLSNLLEYLQLTDIYLFTSKDPNQAVSGTFSYAMSCGCPIISTPIPHAREVFQSDAGIMVDFQNPKQLAQSVISLLNDERLRQNISSNGLHRMASTAWENAAIAHARVFERISNLPITLRFALPEINLDHVKKMTTNFGMIQFSRLNQPDHDSGYTLDDNARALIVMCQHYELTKDPADIPYIHIYFNFIKFCLQTGGGFLNYVNEQKLFTEQNHSTNLADSNGRAIWALGYLLSMSALLPEESLSVAAEAELTMQRALLHVTTLYSTRAMAFIIKGLYYRNTKDRSPLNTSLIKNLANRLVQMYRHETSEKWQWFESYLTYANSTLPEAMLCAWLDTGDTVYKEIAKSSFDFLLSKTFEKNNIKVISNKNWLYKKGKSKLNTIGGEQPIDVAYTILALCKFHSAFKDESYRAKMEMSFNWFLGNNHLHQIIYNPCTGGCYDGLEESYVNLNQGAESTVSYLMARLTIEKFLLGEEKKIPPAISGSKKYYLKN